MARIVPAKPKATSTAVRDLLVELESLLPDSYIIFQGIADSEALLIMAPDRRALVVLVLEGATGVDLDSREVVGEGLVVDLDEIVRVLNADLAEQGMTDADIVLMMPNGDLPESGLALGTALGKGSLRAVAEGDASGGALQMEPGLETIFTINEVLQLQHHGSSEYIPGTITEKQSIWRSENGDQRPEPTGAIADQPGGRAPSIPAQAVITGPARLPHRPVRLTFNEKSGHRVTYLKAMLTACVRNIARNRPIFSSGVEVDPSFVAGPDLLLPAVLVAAAESWTPVVVKAGGIGGFDIRLSRDPQALIGFKVSDVLTASPTTLFMPVAHLIHSTLTEDGEFMLDEIVSTYYRWAQKYDLENAELEAIDLNIALKAIEGETA
jgi:hypothetical protein